MWFFHLTREKSFTDTSEGNFFQEYLWTFHLKPVQRTLRIPVRCSWPGRNRQICIVEVSWATDIVDIRKPAPTASGCGSYCESPAVQALASIRRQACIAHPACKAERQELIWHRGFRPVNRSGVLGHSTRRASCRTRLWRQSGSDRLVACKKVFTVLNPAIEVRWIYKNRSANSRGRSLMSPTGHRQ